MVKENTLSSSSSFRLALAEAGKDMQPEFHSGAVTRPLSAILQLAMMGCPALWARGELAAGACAPMLGWDRGGSSSAGARAWWGACGTGARGPLRGVFGRLPLARLRESAFWGACTKYFRELTMESAKTVRESLPPTCPHLVHLLIQN